MPDHFFNHPGSIVFKDNEKHAFPGSMLFRLPVKVMLTGRKEFPAGDHVNGPALQVGYPDIYWCLFSEKEPDIRYLIEWIRENVDIHGRCNCFCFAQVSVDQEVDRYDGLMLEIIPDDEVTIVISVGQSFSVEGHLYILLAWGRNKSLSGFCYNAWYH